MPMPSPFPMPPPMMGNPLTQQPAMPAGQPLPNPQALQREMLMGMLGSDGLPTGFTMPKSYTPPNATDAQRTHRGEPY